MLRQQTLLQHAALPLILQHLSVTRQLQTVCRLLCTSKGMRAAVSRYSVGLVPVTCFADTLQKAEQFAGWLACHAALLKHLGVTLPPDARSEAESVIAAALLHARTVALRQGPCRNSSPTPAQSLQLQSYACETASSAAGALLQQLPGSHLTSLRLGLAEPLQYPVMAAVALAALTALRSLKLHYSNEFPIVDALLPALSPLQQLEYLDLGTVQNVAELRHLPLQLESAVVNVAAAPADAGGQREALQLQHLTALALLQAADAGGLTLHAGDAMPPACRKLVVANCASVEPLLALEQLQHLCMKRSTTSAEQLLGLSQLTSLTRLVLYDRDAQDAVADAAAAWRRLPLRFLSIRYTGRARQRRESSLSAATLESLRQLQGLQTLSITGATIAATPSQLAVVLGQLTGLTGLVLIKNKMLPEQVDAAEGADEAAAQAADASAEAAGMKALVQAIAGLPQLDDAALASMSLGPAAAAQLAAATNLTSLRLSGTGPMDFALISLAFSMTKLKRLEVTHNPQLTDAPLPVIGRCLPQLTSLSFTQTAVTDIGVECLSSLQQLRLLDVSGTAVSAAAKLRALRQLAEEAAEAPAAAAAVPAAVAADGGGGVMP